MSLWLIALIAIVVLYFAFYFLPVGLWMTARLAGVNIPMFKLIALRLKKVPPPLIVRSLIAAKEAGIDISADDLKNYFLKGGDVNKVMSVLLDAKKNGQDISFTSAAAACKSEDENV